MRYHTFIPGEVLPENLLLPVQTHSANIIEVRAEMLRLENCDGLISSNSKILLGVQTADCAPVVFIGKKRHAILHSGWRGLVDGILEKMLTNFEDEKLQIWIGPMLPVFEIQRDGCFERIAEKFGERFFDCVNEKILFHFLDATLSVLPNAEFCGRSTFADLELASWRRDRSPLRNTTVVGNF